MKTGKIYGVGLGPGDPELITIKAAKIIRQSKYLFFFKKKGNKGRAFEIVKNMISKDTTHISLEYPVTTEIHFSSDTYKKKINDFYKECVEKIELILKQNIDICLLCEGDPFFYGSFIHLYEKLKNNFQVEIIPGITGMSGAWSATKIPMIWGKEVLTVLMGTLEKNKLKQYVKNTDGLVIMKIGKNFSKICKILKDEGLFDKAYLISNATTSEERVIKLNKASFDSVPYFSIILINKFMKKT
ncbi:MAG: precorrin-2 C(20)-methyltransferase [Crocinitomicaceae bacterium]|nr:precorrin-2 C(20)-methyltransferase [Crocinitomicaceae bacterium]